MEKFYTTVEVAELLKVTRLTVTNWIKAGKLKAAKIGTSWRITESDLKQFIEDRTK